MIVTSMTGKGGTEVATRAIGRVALAGSKVADAAVGRLADAGLAPAMALGATRDEILPHVEASPHRVGGAFDNPEPAGEATPDLSVFADMLRRPGRPRRPIMVTRPEFDEPGSLAVTWLGHASALIDIDGVRVLTDPVFSLRCSPSQQIGPARLHPSPVTVADLPPVDVVLISHDHYDHLDMETVAAIARAMPDAIFVAPVGVGAHLVRWGIPGVRIRQADWWGDVTVQTPSGAVTFTCGPARHFSGRALARNLTQWASWAIRGPVHRAFFSGDTGYTERFADLGALHGPFDVTLIAVGAYDPVWPDIHVNPEEAVAIHRMLSGSAGTDAVMIPIHWGTFNLARHPWGEPIARLLPHAARNATTVLVPQPGGAIDLVSRAGTGLTSRDWWEKSA
ncbi:MULTISPECIES: MBL fold metallo-hydrolase [unclassified Gordonia (in: high G+C Gram-positive bacteria)]|uniref:MBL fold metallo-hydrolase n=1 Tax=Gordonia sp. B7-2 TaxID=3420932 RepID=UPI003D90F0E5